MSMTCDFFSRDSWGNRLTVSLPTARASELNTESTYVKKLTYARRPGRCTGPVLISLLNKARLAVMHRKGFHTKFRNTPRVETPIFFKALGPHNVNLWVEVFKVWFPEE